jgi:hypothetical protein
MQASDNARRRFAVAGAASLAQRAIALARDPIERADAVEQVAMVALNDYRGDLAYASFREAADLRAEHAPGDRMAIARACARAVELPMRWPGSMMRVPSEDEVRRYFELGFANVGQGDSEEHVRLLLGRAFVAYAFGPKRAISDEEYDQAVADAERGADMAMRLGRPDLASASLDGASAALWPRGLYGPSMGIIHRRLELAGALEDPWELGDMYAVAAWGAGLVGDYAEAIRFSTRGAALAADEAPGMMLHNLSWRAFAEFSLGNWDVVVDEILPRVREQLGDRVDDPPYFTAHAFGSAAFVHASRGDPEASELVALLRRHAKELQEGQWPELSAVWLAWTLTRMGERAEVRTLLDVLTTGHTDQTRPLRDQVTAVVLADQERWDEVPAFLRRSRDLVRRGQLRALPAHLDRVEGRAAIARGDVGVGIAKLEGAKRGFTELGAVWERAVTDLDLAQALMSARGTADARMMLETVAPDLERAGSLIELERMAKLRASAS